jgi:hypothetical protein
MISRRITAGLLASLIALCGWMYLRDLGGSAVSRSGRERALADATRMLALVTSSGSCAGHCGVDVVGRSGADTWKVQLHTASWRRCFSVRLSAFTYSEQHGLTGLRSAPCPS